MAKKLKKSTGTSEGEIFADLFAQFADKDDAAKALACKLCEQAAFMQITLAELAERIRTEGAVITAKNGNGFDILQENPAKKAYDTMVGRFNSVIASLDKIASKESRGASDELMDFISGRKGGKS